MIRMRLILLFVFGLGLHLAQAQTVTNLSLPNVITDDSFDLTSQLGQKGIMVIYFSDQCPYAQHYLERIKKINNTYSSQGVLTVLVNANATQYSPEESIENMKKYANTNGFQFPYLADKDKKLMKQLGAKRTPEVFLLSSISGELTVVYKGAIDDNPQSASDINHDYLNDAIVNLLSDNTITTKSTRAVGCLIK
jgi:peroxiredoxin